jgi:hypothetical protein
MIGNALILTIAILLALSFWLMGELKFLVPYKAILIQQYGTPIALFLVVVFVNLFAAAFVINRRFFLKDTGRKLSHLDKQLQVGQGELPAPSIDTIDGNDEEVA